MYLLMVLFMWLMSVKTSMAQYAVWDEPIIHYAFEDMSNGDMHAKDSVGSNNLTLYSGGTSLPTVTQGKYGRGVKFDGGGNYAMAVDSDEFSQTGSFSVEAWVKLVSLPATSDFQTVLSKWDETTDIRSYRLRINTDSDGRSWPEFQISTDGTSGNIKTIRGQTQILVGQWYLVSGYYDASVGSINIYINGAKEGVLTGVGSSISNTTSGFCLGATKTGSSTWSNFLTGTVDDIRVVSGARSDASMAYSYERGKPVLKLTFDDGSGNQAVNMAPIYTRTALVNTNNTAWVAGVDNYGLTLTSASSQYIDLGNYSQFQLSKSITLSAWIYVSSLGNYAVISQPNTNGYTFQMTSGGEMVFGALGGTTVTSSGAGILANTWTHVSVAYNGSTAYFYKNARLISSPALSLWSVANGGVAVGKAGITPNYFNGKIDSVMIYPYDRTLFEVYADFSLGALVLGKNYNLVSRNIQKACPVGFVSVPGDPLYGTKDFCVMKYNAKCDADGDGIGDTTGTDTGYNTWNNVADPCSGGSRQIVSTAQGWPLARIAQDAGTANDAKSYCESKGWHLMTNNEYMTIARNAEKMTSNWCDLNGGGCGFSPGQSSKYLASGHNDNGPALGLQASTDDGQGCYGTVTANTNTACGNSGTQKRTMTFSNGEVIWDMAGNLWQWTDNTIMRKDQPDSATSGVGDISFGWTDFASGSITRILVNNGQNGMTYDTFRPSNTLWNANQGVGRIYTYSDLVDTNTTVYAFLRGGVWDNSTYAGLFTLLLVDTPGNSSYYSVGFRCVAPSQ